MLLLIGGYTWAGVAHHYLNIAGLAWAGSHNGGGSNSNSAVIGGVFQGVGQ